MREESLVRDVSLFSRFMEVACFSQGEMINYTEVAREVGSNRHTIASFFDILNDLLIAWQIPVFTKRAKRVMVAQSKFYYFDPGVYRALRPMGPLDMPEELDGKLLETLFLQEIKAINDYQALGYDIYHWRTQGQVEVDFVAYGQRGLKAFKIKRKASLNTKDFKGLQLFKKDYPMAECFMLYGGDRSYVEDDIRVVPFAEGVLSLGMYL